jgi:hypothetical protein
MQVCSISSYFLSGEKKADGIMYNVNFLITSLAQK